MEQKNPFPAKLGKRADRKPSKRKRIFRIILAIPFVGLAVLLTLVAFVLGMTISTWKELDIEKLENAQQSSLIYDYREEKITNIHGIENRIKVPLSDIPDHVQKAFVATEDIRFYKHPGFDIKRLAASVWHNLKARAYVQGGGTITQQVVRNAFLTQKKVMSRKIQEIYLAYQLEKKFSKDQILQTYLNLIYFGKGAYGVEAASNRYFGKSIKEVNIAEGAMLAGIIKNPGRYSPLINEKNSLDRKNLVIDLMVKNGYLDPKEGVKAKEEPIKLVDTPPNGYAHNFFMDMVLKEAADILKVKEETLFTSGYKIYTTLDKELQTFSEEIFANDDFFPKSPVSGLPCQSALVVLDSSTGEVRALIGGRTDDSETVRKAFNRATQSKRQPGSIVKPLVVFGPAIESFGYTPVTFIEDAPFTIDDYSPSNYGGNFRGWVTLREAVASSINIPAVKVLYDIGINNGMSFAKTLGIPFADEDRNLSIALGGFHYGISPIELARAYTTLADDGKYKEYTTIRRIVDPKGVNVYQLNPQKSQLVSEETAFILNNILQSTVQLPGGTASRLKSLGIPLSAKTGTAQLPKTQEFENIKDGTKDAWVTTYNPDYVVTVWMGFDETNSENYLPAGVVGGSFPTEIAKEIMGRIYKNRKAKTFVKPLNVLEVKLDAKALKEHHEALLASPLTPDDEIVVEYFTRYNVPRYETDYWVTPNTPWNFDVTLSPNGLPIISFMIAQPFAAYDIYRFSNNMWAAPVHHIEPENQSRVQWTDTSVKAGETYSYYVIATHPEIVIEGKPVESPPTPVLNITIPYGLNPSSQEWGQSQENIVSEIQEEGKPLNGRKKISIQIP